MNENKSLVLKYDKGTIIAETEEKELALSLPHLQYDVRTKNYRALAFYYCDILKHLVGSNTAYEDNVLNLNRTEELVLSSQFKLRSYQTEALEAWINNLYRGIIVLPTGSGKTLIGIYAIARLNTSTLIVVPTLDLMYQWQNEIRKAFNISVGQIGGGKNIMMPITLITYDSAYLNVEYLGDKFALLILDETHHAPARKYQYILKMMAAPYRLGLTATLERADGLHKILPLLVGDTVYVGKLEDMKGKYLSDFETKTVFTRLTPDEQIEYDKQQKVFVDYIRKEGLNMMSSADYQMLVLRSGVDSDARRALLAKNEAKYIMLNSKNKIKELEKILQRHTNDRIIIFTQHNDLVYNISRQFLLPAITYRTIPEERKEILQKFKVGDYRAIVSSNVLNEGVDVQDANVGVIISGSGSKREFRQRLGRLLRKSKKSAILYEIVSQGTSEVSTSMRRKAKIEEESE